VMPPPITSTSNVVLPRVRRMSARAAAGMRES
jgi:hypothetical protein